MLRATTALAALGLLALAFAIGLQSGNSAMSGLLSANPSGSPIISGSNGRTITLDMVQKELDWRRETAQMLRGMN